MDRRIREELVNTFKKYHGQLLNRAYLMAATLQSLKVTVEEYSTKEREVFQAVSLGIQEGWIQEFKSDITGYGFKLDSSKLECPNWEPKIQCDCSHCLGKVNLSKASIAINDHVCPTCRNDRVSKTEKSCWKCGNAL